MEVDNIMLLIHVLIKKNHMPAKIGAYIFLPL